MFRARRGAYQKGFAGITPKKGREKGGIMMGQSLVGKSSMGSRSRAQTHARAIPLTSGQRITRAAHRRAQTRTLSDLRAGQPIALFFIEYNSSIPVQQLPERSPLQVAIVALRAIIGYRAYISQAYSNNTLNSYLGYSIPLFINVVL